MRKKLKKIAKKSIKDKRKHSYIIDVIAMYEKGLVDFDGETRKRIRILEERKEPTYEECKALFASLCSRMRRR